MTQNEFSLINKCNLLETELNQIKLLLEGKNIQYQQLKEEVEILRASLSNIGTYKCSKCGYYTPYGYVCFNCKQDNSIENEV